MDYRSGVIAAMLGNMLGGVREVPWTAGDFYASLRADRAYTVDEQAAVFADDPDAATLLAKVELINAAAGGIDSRFRVAELLAEAGIGSNS